MGIAFLIIFVFVLGICALLLWLLSLHNRLGGARAAAQLALSRLETESMRRGESIGRLVDAARIFMHSQKEVLEGVLVCRNTLATAIGSAVASASQAKWFFLWFEAELELERSLKRFQIAAADFSEFRSARNILQLGGELDLVSERVELFRNAYNEASRSFNQLWNGVVSGLFARFLGYDALPLLESEKKIQPSSVSYPSSDGSEATRGARFEPSQDVKESQEEPKSSGSRVFYG